MTPKMKMGSSTQRLSDVARHVRYPSTIKTTEWTRVVAKCRQMGVEFDSWQHGVGSIALGKNADGKFSASVGGIVLSIPRQVGKTFLVGMIIIALCLIHPGLTVLWSAHRTRTATKTFGTLKGMTSRKKIARNVLNPRNTNGEQEIRFRNSSVIMFGAREHGFGRGFDEVDVEVFDEAQILGEKALEDMVAATNQSRHLPGGALLFFMGTPPRPSDDGAEFGARRARAIAGEDDEIVYVEFSADEDADPHDMAQLAKANPSYPHRTPPEAIRRMRKNLTNAASFRREALGIWDLATQEQPVIESAEFTNLIAPPPDSGPVAYGVRYSVDGSRVSLSVAVATETGAFVEVVDSAFSSVGIAVTCDWLTARWRSCDAIVLDGKAGAGALQEALLDAGVNHRRIIRPGFEDVITASSNFVEMVRDGSLSHAGQPGLIACVKDAKRRPIGTAGGWGFGSMSGELDQSPLESVALAVHGLGGVRRRDGKKRVAGGGRMVGA